jgi:hypothetical protein
MFPPAELAVELPAELWPHSFPGKMTTETSSGTSRNNKEDAPKHAGLWLG